jgi:hypothetical protein
LDPLSTLLLLFIPGAVGEEADVPETGVEDVETEVDEIAVPDPVLHEEPDVPPPDR